MKLRSILLSAMLCALCVCTAGALEYSVDAPEDYLFGRPTSDETLYEQEQVNVNRGKDTVLIAPAFGSPTSYLPGSGEALTPNLIPGGHLGPVLLRWISGDAEDPHAGPVRQGL